MKKKELKRKIKALSHINETTFAALVLACQDQEKLLNPDEESELKRLSGAGNLASDYLKRAEKLANSGKIRLAGIEIK